MTWNKRDSARSGQAASQRDKLGGVKFNIDSLQAVRRAETHPIDEVTIIGDLAT
jgi:hypothetical protein